VALEKTRGGLRIESARERRKAPEGVGDCKNSKPVGRWAGESGAWKEGSGSVASV
jgi:hypothetical protein